ncbi:conserved Plasmodium protein, unknown function [Plasmodium ovale wallikeri]|uniref:Sulfhydryl oxidase n=2 Tax=Plasmodium ovale TaxID=36330 RepID=A0A1A8YQG3_PLAOA|nr:conserved Plasmodium protein, unknown function [Plasmodium ovale wallikeri]SBT34375.1 conserved Plasmodium protein, unknown function [Plasmodium ovale wallikeri]SBT76582.1 conserved Plasmodium protein, unknown function [Plasmodium ovale]
MGNRISNKIIKKEDDTKQGFPREVKHMEDENKGRLNGSSLPQANLSINIKKDTENKFKGKNEQLTMEMLDSNKYDMENNNEIKKIKEENFYSFDESLNSNNVKHPCHAQWFLFWVFASYLNENFSESEKEYVHSFYSNFPEQCINGKGKNCFSEFSQIYPVRAKTREELMTWLQMCENYCRKKAELPVKIFNYRKLLKRWRYDDDYI